MSPLQRKLLRDLWRVRGQAASIALVVALGVLLLVMMSGLVTSLQATRDAYYDRYRIADIFAPVKRAPLRLLEEVQALDGVDSVVGRVVGGALIDLPGESAPIRAQTVSLPDIGPAPLNEIHLVRGRRPNASHPEEVVLLEGFATARNIQLGDPLSATLYGTRQTFKVVGLAQAPEFVIAMAPGDFAPDDSRYAVLWLSDRALAAVFDMDGAFNEALIKVERGIDPSKLIAQVDRVLDPQGGLGAYTLTDQLSNRFVTEEIEQLAASSATVPPIFLGVAAFLLYIVMARMIQIEREQIGLLKSFGYSNAEVGWHYTQFVLVIAVTGALLGMLLGWYAGSSMAQFYQRYFKFPFLVFSLPPRSLMLAFAVSVLAAAAGGLLVVRRVFALSPAVAMRPPSPPKFSRSRRWLQSILDRFDQPTRMILRQLLRQPGRTMLAVTGISTGMALSVGMLAILNSFDELIDLNYAVLDRSDMTVVFTEPRGYAAAYELARLAGVHQVEPIRAVSVKLRHGNRSHRGSINGFISEPELQRAVDADEQPIYLREEGIILSQALANKLKAQGGDLLRVEVQEGRRPTLDLPVLAVAKSLLGAPAYLEINSLNRALKEPLRLSGASLTIDEQQTDALYNEIKNMPGVAGVSRKEDARQAIVRMMSEGAGAMRYVMAAIAGLITFGIIYNSARISFGERARDLSSLRVFGFTRGEAAYVLLGELVLLAILALPVGMAGGLLFANAVAVGFSTELYQVPGDVPLVAHAGATLAVLTATVLSALIVRRDLYRLNIVSALKTRE